MRTYAIATAALSAMLIAGCGDSDRGGDSEKAGVQLRAEDAKAKSDARTLFGLIQSCLAEKQERTYADCDEPAELGATGLRVTKAGSKPGQGEVSVVRASDDRKSFALTAKSKTGTDFTIGVDQAGQQFRRTCSNAGKGGCGPDGTW